MDQEGTGAPGRRPAAGEAPAAGLGRGLGRRRGEERAGADWGRPAGATAAARAPAFRRGFVESRAVRHDVFSATQNPKFM